jgi:hypothetical protein
VAIAGSKEWFSPPGADPIHGVGCDEGGDLFVLGADWLGRIYRYDDDPSIRSSVNLPPGDYHLVAMVNAGAWVWGHAKQRWVVLRYDASGMSEVFESPTEIRALTTAGVDSALIALDRRLVIVAPGQKPNAIATLDGPPDGLAVAGDGSVFVSLPDGIVRIGVDKKITAVTRGVHGPLELRYKTLYVLWREAAEVLRLEPHKNP